MSYVELRFSIMGKTIPTDHGYIVFGAISRYLPDIHEAGWISIETLPGMARGDGITQLDLEARLKMRVPQDQVPHILKLSGKQLNLGIHKIRLGIPTIHLLNPSSSLYSRCTTIKNHKEPESFLKAVCHKLDELGIHGDPEVGVRRVVRVGAHIIVGFSLTIHSLTEDASIFIQERGIGGRRHMGCGIFNPIPVSKEKSL
jgi:CRISPR-associated protein Cas6